MFLQRRVDGLAFIVWGVCACLCLTNFRFPLPVEECVGSTLKTLAYVFALLSLWLCLHEKHFCSFKLPNSNNVGNLSKLMFCSFALKPQRPKPFYSLKLLRREFCCLFFQGQKHANVKKVDLRLFASTVE